MKKTVLVVDDDPGVLSALRRVLISDGYDAFTAGNGKEALAVLKKDKADLIILDLKMDTMSGVAFLKEISLADGKLQYPVLVLTAYASMTSFFDNIDISGFMLKPCSEDALLSEVHRIAGEPSKVADVVDDRKVSFQGFRKRMVLIAEDDDVVSAALTQSFERAGHTVKRALTGSEAIGKAILEQPDLLVIKEVLSEMNGDTVSQTLRNIPKTSNIPIILYDNEGYAESRGDQLVKEHTVNTYIPSNRPAEVLKAGEQFIG